VSADDMRPPEDEWTPMQVASLEASDFERIDPWTSPLSVAQLQGKDNSGLMGAMAIKKAPVTRAPPDYLADTPGTNTIVWNKAHDGHILADWPGGSKIAGGNQAAQEEHKKEIQRRAESNSLLRVCDATEGSLVPSGGGDSAVALRKDALRSELKMRTQESGQRGERTNLVNQESASEREAPTDDAVAVPVAAPKVPSDDAARGDAASGEGDAAGGAVAAGDGASQAEWVASWQVAPDGNGDASQEAPTARAARQQAEIQRLRIELERLEAMHTAEFTGEAKPPVQPLEAQPQVLPPLASIGHAGKMHS